MGNRLTFREPTAGDCPFDAEMLAQDGECHQLDLRRLAARVGEDQLWGAISSAVLRAMQRWAVDGPAGGVGQRYSVWVAQRRGTGETGQEIPLALVYVVQHPTGDGPGPDGATDAQRGRPSPFHEPLREWPEYVRMERGNPLWEGARPWYLVSDGVAVRIDDSVPTYCAIADAVLARQWQDRCTQDDVTGDATIAGEDDREMGRGAMAYLRTVVRERHYRTMFDLPDHMDGPFSIPQWIADYFDSGGMLLHTQDYARDHETVLLALTQYPDLVAEAPVGWSIELGDTPGLLVHLLTFEDPEEGDLSYEFIYDLRDRGHLDELASLAVQNGFRLHILTVADEGDYCFLGTRALGFDDDTRMVFARMVAPVILACATTAQVHAPALSAADDAPNACGPGSDERPAPEILASLRLKESRVAAVQLLCRMRDARYASQIRSAIEGMTWAEVDQVWQDLPLLGEAAVEEFVRLTDKPKKKAAAACGMRALGRIACKRSLEVLSALVRDLGSKSEPTEALVELGDYAIPTLLELSHNAKAEVRQMAAYAIGKIGSQHGRDRVDQMASADRSARVRSVAAKAILWIDGDEECDMDLRDFYGNIELE